MKYQSQTLTPDIRSNAGYTTASLSAGETHYVLEGPETGEPVVLVHGFSMPLFVWDYTASFLAGKGCRVLRYDLYGRGFSDRPRVRYTIDLFRNQLRELLNYCGFTTQKIHLAGVSMGGIIVSDFAVHYPDIIGSVSLFDSAGMPAKSVPVPPVIRIPLLGRILFHTCAPGTMQKNVSANFYNKDSLPHFVSLFTQQMQYKGFTNALHSTLLHLDLSGFADTMKQLGNLHLPVLLVWGKEDAIIDYRTHTLFLQSIPQAQFFTIQQCGHMPMCEKPGETNRLLYSFLQSHTLEW